ncbi:YidH family protein [Leptolyngbya sp. FACHB-261]|uniref:YidH family protein n=1 Tax=Leptolyngbya sp. FACHB-261 TaxID=2692806 RepID=UPI001682CF33|nr:DUF202 domain-containing protein [Leptolyngbya sp. FACHB-261]MBD2104500.1 DUF202 domain-containing protein [Leptolyngbya sp. FACHB-261]
MTKIDRQREHQANERTFLAWLRTSVTLIGFGFAIARFGLFLQELQVNLTTASDGNSHTLGARGLGISLVIAGVALIALAAWRYNQVFEQIERSDYQPSRLLIWIVTAVVIGLGTLTMPLVLWRKNSTQPKLEAPRKPTAHP